MHSRFVWPHDADVEHPAVGLGVGVVPPADLRLAREVGLRQGQRREVLLGKRRRLSGQEGSDVASVTAAGSDSGVL